MDIMSDEFGYKLALGDLAAFSSSTYMAGFSMQQAGHATSPRGLNVALAENGKHFIDMHF